MSAVKPTFSKEELLEKDRNFVWHHISPHNDEPLIMVSGEGCWLDGYRW